MGQTTLKPVDLDLQSGAGCEADPLEQNAQKLKVCGHPVRLKLLRLIARDADPCVGELWACLGQSQPVVSQHLAVLKEHGIVKSEAHGNRRTYSIADPFVRELVRLLEA